MLGAMGGRGLSRTPALKRPEPPLPKLKVPDGAVDSGALAPGWVCTSPWVAEKKSGSEGPAVAPFHHDAEVDWSVGNTSAK